MRRDKGRFSLPLSPSPLLIHLQNLPRINITDYQAERLHDIVCNASTSSKSAIFERLSCYLRDVFLPGSPHHRPAAAIHQQQQTRRQARRREYATTQRHWRSNRMRCIKNILGNVEDVKQPPRAAMEPYWTTVFIQPATITMPECTQHPAQDSIASPIKAEEIRAIGPSLAISPGPDGLAARQFRAIRLGITVRIFNLILWCENLPKHLAISRTIFIPKKSHASLPEEFRPISISCLC